MSNDVLRYESSKNYTMQERKESFKMMYILFTCLFTKQETLQAICYFYLLC